MENGQWFEESGELTPEQMYYLQNRPEGLLKLVEKMEIDVKTAEIMVSSVEELEKLKIKLAVLRIEIPINLQEKEDAGKNQEYFLVKIKNMESALRHTITRLSIIKDKL